VRAGGLRLRVHSHKIDNPRAAGVEKKRGYIGRSVLRPHKEYPRYYSCTIAAKRYTLLECKCVWFQECGALLMIEKITSRLGKQTDILINVLRESPGEWFSRSDIAKVLEKRKLSSYDIAMLEILQEKGLIEIQLRDNRTPIGFEFVYRVPE
jgi:hypothetical protein